jgi:hypothetical protein
MSQKSSLPQAASSVSQVLKRDRRSSSEPTSAAIMSISVTQVSDVAAYRPHRIERFPYKVDLLGVI